MAGRAGPAPRLGIHIGTAAGLTAAARHALKIGSRTFQIMSGNPSAWKPGRLDPKKAEEFRAFCQDNDLGPIFLHAGYLINLSCRTGRNAPIYAKSVRLLQQTMARAAALGCPYVVVHLGSRRGGSQEEALASLIEGLGKLDAADQAGRSRIRQGSMSSPGDSRSPLAGSQARSGGDTAPDREAGRPMLLLENSAGQGDYVGSDIKELGLVLREAARRGFRQELGICLDTAHLWGAGYDLTSGAAAKRLIQDFDAAVGLERLHLVHLNDSPVERGSQKDRHEHIGCGLISIKALAAIVRHPGLRDVAMIMETAGSSNPSDEQRMADLRSLAGV